MYRVLQYEDNWVLKVIVTLQSAFKESLIYVVQSTDSPFLNIWIKGRQ